MKTYTVQDVMALRPCQPTEDDPDAGYPEWRVRELFGERWTITLLDICDDERVPIADRQWVLHRLAPESLVHEAACRYAERALERERAAGREPDPRSWAAVEAKRAWLRGEISNTRLRATSTAAKAVTWAAWSAAALDAAWAAAWAATGAAEAARDARDAARSAAAKETALAATRLIAEQQWQLDMLRAMIVEYGEQNDE